MADEFADYVAIAAVLDIYANGGRTGDAQLMATAFHSAATIHGYIQGKLLSGPIQLLFDWVSANPPAPQLRTQVGEIAISGSVATARLELADWNGVRFTDSFALLKTNGEWHIVTKLFHAHDNS